MSDDGLEPIETDAATGDRSGLARHDTTPEGQATYEGETPEGTVAVWAPKTAKAKMPMPPPLSERSDSNLTFADIRARLYGVPAEEEEEYEPLPVPPPVFEEVPVTPRLAERERQFQASIGPVTAAQRRGPGRPRKNPA